MRKAILEFNSYLTGSDVGKIKFLHGISCVSKSYYCKNIFKFILIMLDVPLFQVYYHRKNIINHQRNRVS